MRKIFWGAVTLAILLVVSLLGFGSYINIMGERQITKYLESRRLQVIGGKAEQHTFEPVLKLRTIKLESTAMADAMALVDGRIREVLVTPSDKVVAGQPVCYLDNPQYMFQIREIDSKILEADISCERARSAYERYRRLWNQEAASKEKFEASKAEYEASLKRRDALQAQKEQLLLQLDYQTVVSPTTGTVLLVYYAKGSFVKA